MTPDERVDISNHFSSENWTILAVDSDFSMVNVNQRKFFLFLQCLVNDRINFKNPLTHICKEIHRGSFKVQLVFDSISNYSEKIGSLLHTEGFEVLFLLILNIQVQLDILELDL